MVYPYDSAVPKIKFYQSVVHRYGTSRPLIPVTTHQVYTQKYYDYSATNLIAIYIFLILFLSLCYRLIDKALFQGRLINSIFSFGNEDLHTRVENESDEIDYSKYDDEDSYCLDDLEEKEKKEEKAKKEEKKQKVEKETLESPENAEIEMF